MKAEIPCVGHLSSEDIVRASGLNYSEFDGKNVLDIGCGFSGFLRHLGQQTQVKRLVGVDPVFNDDNTIAHGISQTKEYIHRLLETPDISEFAREQLHSRLEDIYLFSQSREAEEYYPTMISVGGERFDYIFISFVYRHLSDIMKMQMDQQICNFLAAGGATMIIDGMPELKALRRRLGNSKVYVGDPEHFEKSVSILRIS